MMNEIQSLDSKVEAHSAAQAAELTSRGSLESDLRHEREARQAVETQTASLRDSLSAHSRKVGGSALELAAAVEGASEVLQQRIIDIEAESNARGQDLKNAETGLAEVERCLEEERGRWRLEVEKRKHSVREAENELANRAQAYDETLCVAQEALLAEQVARSKAEIALAAEVETCRTVKGQLDEAGHGRSKDREKSVIIMEKQRAEIEAIKAELALSVSETEAERSRHRIEIQQLKGTQREADKDAAKTSTALRDALEKIAAQDATMTPRKEREMSLAGMEQQLQRAQEEAHFTSQALTETLSERDGLKASLDAFEAELEAEKSRHRIEVRQLEGTMQEMMKDINTKEAGESAAALSAEKASMQAKAAFEQVTAEAVEAQSKAQAEARELSCEVLRLQGVVNGNANVIRSLEAELTSLSDALRKVRQELSQAERGKSTVRWCNEKVSRMALEVARQVSVELKQKKDAIQILQSHLTAAKGQGFISPTARSRPGSPRTPSSLSSPVSPIPGGTEGFSGADGTQVGHLQRKVAGLEAKCSQMTAELEEWGRVWEQSKSRIHELESQAASDIETMDELSQNLEDIKDTRSA